MANIQEIIKSSGFIEESKAILIDDCYSQLEGIYGIKPEGSFENMSSLPNLKENSKEYAKREKLEKYFEIQINTGKKSIEILSTIVKEYAFTYLNRFVAIKMMEERKIIKQSFSRAFESNNFKFYLADNPDAEILWKQGKVYETYERFLDSLFTELSKDEEIKVLFNAEHICSLLFPQEKTLRLLFELLNQDPLKDIWGEDDVIGWVYQYFIEDEKAKVFDKIYKQKKKLALRDIPAATQIFTPKWIVKYLIENTLGRLWIRMHPDSKLREKMQYFVPNEQDNDIIPLKKVCDITLLDPACGTMHFGMYAFDIFYEMYLEEINNNGNADWPNEASVKDINLIPQFIIEYNIYGIDIDLRAIQLSALSLYLKAKSINKSITLRKYNLACTDIPPFTEEVLNRFVKDLPVEHDITKKLLLKILPEFNKAYYLGSLLKIEDVVESFVEKEKVALEKVYQYNLFGGEKKTQQVELGLQIERKIIWEDVKMEIKEALIKFTESHKGNTDSFIAGESVKGLNLIDALIKKHDVIVSNPPYSGKRNWPEYLSKDLKEIYKKNSGDLYTCFIDRCIDSVTFNGFIGLVTIHTFMFTSSNEEIRRRIIEETQIETLVHLGTKTEFEVANKTAQGFVMYALQKKASINKNCKGVYFRVVNEEDIEKHTAFLNGLKLLLDKSENQYISFYIIEQSKLKVIPSWPLVYWISDGIREIFKDFAPLSQFAPPKAGLQTSDTFRFLRYWWEVGKENILACCNSEQESEISGKLWIPYLKGGKYSKWYGNQEYIVKWGSGAKELRKWIDYKKTINQMGYITGEEFYFSEGATFNLVTVSKLCVRYFPKGFIFDIASPSLFHKNIKFYLGILNSPIFIYLANLIAPTVNSTPGDIGSIPVPSFSDKESNHANIISLVNDCIELKKYLDNRNEETFNFEALIPWKRYCDIVLNINRNLILSENKISQMTYRLYGLNNNDIETIKLIIGELSSNLEIIDDLNDHRLKVLNSLYLKKHIPTENLFTSIEENEDKNDIEIKENRKQSRFLNFEEICLKSSFHPDTVYNYIVANKLERHEERYELAVRWISYVVGIIMGRFKHEGIEADDDGICVLDEGHKDDLPQNVFIALEKCLYEITAKEVIEVINQNTTDSLVDILRNFLERDFFTKWHIPMYKKRPVYWLLQSKEKNYGFYIYNLKFSNESLYSLIQKYIIPKLQLENAKLIELTVNRNTSKGYEKRKIEAEISKVEDLIDEIEQFRKDIQDVIDTEFKPNINDGVILNMAPIYKLIPSWKEPEKYYKKLQEGEYEWSTVSKSLFQNIH